MPQSSANTIRSTWTRPRSSSETSVTWALWPRKPEQVIPRARPSGSGDPQPARSAASSSARSVRGLSASSSRRRSTGSRPAAIASSSIADSRANSVCELPTDRHTIVGTPRLEVGRLELEVRERVRRVDGAGRREEVDAVREHHVADERQVHRRRLGHDLLVAGRQATVRVGRGAHAVDGHRPVAADLELLLAQRLHLDRVLPVERSRDLHGLGRRVALGARVQPERSAGEGDVHLDLLLVDPGDRRGVHLHVLGRLGARPTPRARRPRASGTPRCSAPSARERGTAACTSRRSSSAASAERLRRRRRRRARRTACSPDSSSRRCSASSSSELRRSAFVSSHSTTSARSPRCASATRLADDGDALVDRDDRDHPGLGERRRGRRPRRPWRRTAAGAARPRSASRAGSTSIVNRVVPRIFGTASTRSRPSRPISL